jgi:hypothetical protein
MAELDKIVSQFLEDMRRLLDAEYHRGEQNAIARIMKAAQGVPSTAAQNGAASPSRPSSEVHRERAPAGAAEALIDRVLAERGSRGASATEIMEAAKTTTEKMVSYSGIRFRLDQGREQHHYRNKDGKWFRIQRGRIEAESLPEGDSR